MAARRHHDEEEEGLREAFPDATRRFEFLYGMLSVLDSKASSLMAFNAIGLTALAVWLEGLPLNWLHFSLDLVFLLFLISAATCFFVVRVHWSPAAHLNRSELQMQDLLDERDHRTHLYRWAWWLAILAVGLFLMVSAVHTGGTLLRAAGECGKTCAAVYSEEVWGRKEPAPATSASVPPSASSPAPMPASTPRP